jgi:hypothetical protein
MRKLASHVEVARLIFLCARFPLNSDIPKAPGAPVIIDDHDDYDSQT